MKLSLCNEVIREMPFARQCDFAAALGYEAVELAPFTIADDPRRIGAGEVAEMRRALADAGIVCSSLHWLLIAPDGLSITAEDAGVRRETVEVMRRLVDLAAELGAEVLIHGSPKQRQLPQGAQDAARARAVECFRAAAEAAEAAGVVYAVEPLAGAETSFVNTLDDAAQIVEAVGSSAFRSMLDCAATGRQGLDVVEELDRHLGSGLIAHVHLNDPSRRGPGEGEMRFAPILAALRRHGYDRWLGVEPFVYEPDGPACAARSMGYLKGILEALE